MNITASGIIKSILSGVLMFILIWIILYIISYGNHIKEQEAAIPSYHSELNILRPSDSDTPASTVSGNGLFNGQAQLDRYTNR